MVKLKKLRPGDTIGFAAPSHVAQRERYEKNARVLESLGYRVKFGANLFCDTYGYSATERERAGDFNSLAADPEVSMVFFGGGEGGNELLPYLDYDVIGRNPKFYLSYSDGTTILTAIHSLTGLPVYYGQTPGTFEDLRYYDYTQFMAHFADETPELFRANSRWRVLGGGTCEGILTGGYTRNYAMMLGGRYFSYDKNARYLLFLEDHEKFSDIATVSAYISHIEQHPIIDCISGLIFGNYSVNETPELYDRLKRFATAHGVPVVYCDDFGHGVNHAILPVGAAASLDAGRCELRFKFN